MKKIIAVVNQAGGAGKSTLTQNLGYHLALKNNRVLLIDMDPQASLTSFMGLNKNEVTVEKNIYGALTDKAPLTVWDEPIHGMRIVPTNKQLASTEIEVIQDTVVDNRMRLRLALDQVTEDFDYILIDCPPSLGLLSVMSLIAATHAVVPLQTQYKCYLGTDELLGTIARIKKAGHSELKIACIVPIMYDARNKQDKGILEEIKNQLEGKIHVTKPIPKSTYFADASQEHVPFALYKKGHPTGKLLQDIATYIEKI